MMSVCYKPAKPASSAIKALQFYNKNIPPSCSCQLSARGTLLHFFKPATCHTAMTSCMSIDTSCQEPRTSLHAANPSKPQHLWSDGCKSWQRWPKMVLSSSSQWSASKSTSVHAVSLWCAHHCTRSWCRQRGERHSPSVRGSAAVPFSSVPENTWAQHKEWECPEVCYFPN